MRGFRSASLPSAGEVRVVLKCRLFLGVLVRRLLIFLAVGALEVHSNSRPCLVRFVWRVSEAVMVARGASQCHGVEDVVYGVLEVVSRSLSHLLFLFPAKVSSTLVKLRRRGFLGF